MHALDEDVAMQRVGGFGWGEPLKPVQTEQVLNVLAGSEDADVNGDDQAYWMAKLMRHSDYGALPWLVAREVIQFIASHRCVAFKHGRNHLIESIEAVLEER